MTQLSSDFSPSPTPEPVVRAMPEAFLPKGGRPVTASSANQTHHRWVLIVGLIFLLLVIIGAVLALGKWRPLLTGVNQFMGNSAATSTPSATVTTTPQIVPETGASTPAGRDEERLRHLTSLQTALGQYRQVNGRYPATLDQLSGYLTPLPIDPSGSPYNYNVLTDGSSYQLSFNLETGGMFGQQRLIAGSFWLTPQGVQLQSSPINPIPSSTAPLIEANPPPSTVDSDGDGLTDMEEAQYTTDINKSDTDGDGYVDGVEVRAGFSPLNAQPQTLLQAGLVDNYHNVTQGYQVMYPTGWTVRALDPPVGSQVTLTAPNEEFFEVIVEANPQGLSPLQWYQEQHQSTSTLTNVTLGTLVGVKSPDGLSVYVSGGDNMYMLVYSLGGASQASFFTTWQMFQQSFKLVTP